MEAVDNWNFPLIDDRLVDAKEEIVHLFYDLLQLPFTRGDYKELVELTLFYLEGTNQGKFKGFKRPGAMHQARCYASSSLDEQNALLLEN